MEIFQTEDYTTLAKLNKNVHDLHVQLYPDYFTPYSFEDMKNEFKKLVDNGELHLFNFVR